LIERRRLRIDGRLARLRRRPGRGTRFIASSQLRLTSVFDIAANCSAECGSTPRTCSSPAPRDCDPSETPRGDSRSATRWAPYSSDDSVQASRMRSMMSSESSAPAAGAGLQLVERTSESHSRAGVDVVVLEDAGEVAVVHFRELGAASVRVRRCSSCATMHSPRRLRACGGRCYWSFPTSDFRLVTATSIPQCEWQ